MIGINEIKNFGKAIIQIIRNTGRKLNKRATGKTLRSLTAETKINVLNNVELSIYGSKVFEYIERGRYPFGKTTVGSDGKPVAKMPPEGVLLEWMSKRGIPDSAEFAVRYVIARDGIKPTPLLEESFRIVNQKFTSTLTKDVSAKVSQEISKLISKGFQFPNIKSNL